MRSVIYSLFFILLLFGIVLNLSCASSQSMSSGEAKNPDEEATVTYTCPMHPEVASYKPGVCPKCGMTLVVKKTGAETKPASQPDMGGMQHMH